MGAGVTRLFCLFRFVERRRSAGADLERFLANERLLRGILTTPVSYCGPESCKMTYLMTADEDEKKKHGESPHTLMHLPFIAVY